MSEQLNPDKIYRELLEKKISYKDALKLYEEILNKSDVEEFRAKTIKYLGSIESEREKIYKLLENSLISDDSAIIRCASAQILTEKFIDYDISPLLWAIDNETSVYFFKHILMTLESKKFDNTDIIKQRILIKLSNHYNLDYNNSRFILDIDYLDYLRFKAEFDDFLTEFNLSDTEIQELIKENSQLGFKGLSRIKKVEERQINALDLRNLEEIPNSICKLEKLKSLEISKSKLKKLPEDCKNLEALSNLVLTNNEIDYLPIWLIKYAKDEIRTLFYTKEGVNSTEAYLLVILEVLSGHKCIIVNNPPHAEHLVSVCYRINEEGDIVGLYYSNKNYPLGIIPKELCQLNYLEDIVLSNQRIRIIPNCLCHLLNLRLINLSKNNLSMIPVELSQINSAKLIDLRDNPLKKVPSTIKKIRSIKLK